MPATLAIGRPVFSTRRSISSEQARSTGSKRSMPGARISNCVKCMPTAIPPTPAST